MSKSRVGSVYRCPVCGAELSVIRSGEGMLEPVCCNTKMILIERINRIYVCPVCGCEIMLIRGSSERLEPVCCNTPMKATAGA